jgi:hypothetical protein
VRYLHALLFDPHDVLWDDLRDDEVRALPDRARYEFELDDDPVAWSAPVGVVCGILPAASRTGPLEPPAAAAVGRARAFVEAAARSDHIDRRREMRRLAPTLLAEYLERLEPRRRG